MARIHIKNPREICFIHICRSTELNMHLDFTGPSKDCMHMCDNHDLQVFNIGA